jgi:glycosyltransferase involved in cell wall biosynthesis
LSPAILHIDAEPIAIAALHAAVYSRLLRVPLTMFVWENTDRYLWRSDEPGKRLFFVRILMRRFVLATVKHFCCGNAEAARLLHKWGYRGELTVVPQFGVDAEDYPKREREPVGPGFILGYVGRLIPEKGIDVLIRAAGLLKAKGVAVRLCIVGKGPEDENLRHLAADLGLAGVVDFVGAVADDQVATVMAGFHVLVLPSRTTPSWKEQFGKVLIEAMVIGLPVMGSRSGEIPNVIADERQTFDEGDAGDLAAKLSVLQEDVNLRRALAVRNQDHVAKKYTQTVVAERYKDIWAEVTRAAGRRQC